MSTSYKSALADSEKQSVINEALQSPEGQAALLDQVSKKAADVQKMMGYRSLGQKLLCLCEGTDNEFVHFDGSHPHFYAVNPVTDKLQQFDVPSDLFIMMEDFYTVYFHRSYKYKTERKIHPAVIDSLSYRCIESLSADTNTFVINAFVSALKLRKNKKDRTANPETSSIVEALRRTSGDIIGLGSVMTKIVVNPDDLWLFRDKYYIDEATTREIVTTGLYAHVDTADVHVSNAVPKGTALCSGYPTDVGEYVVAKSDAQGAVTSRVMSQSVNVCLKNIELIRSIDFRQEA